MKFIFAAALALATSAIAAPGRCVSQSQADALMLQWGQMMSGQPSALGSPKDTAEAIMAKGYYEVSDSVESMTGQALGTVPTNVGKQSNIKSLLAFPVYSVNTTMTLISGCDKVIWYWTMKITPSPEAQEVKGINIFTVNNNQIQNSFFEFNSIAWATDIHKLPAQCYAGEASSSTTNTTSS